MQTMRKGDEWNTTAIIRLARDEYRVRSVSKSTWVLPRLSDDDDYYMPPALIQSQLLPTLSAPTHPFYAKSLFRILLLYFL